MKLKNTDELRRRAKAHRKMGNFASHGGYGGNATSGDPNEILACGIGCLAAPHTKRKFSALIARLGLSIWSASSERSRLKEEFGISHRFSWVIEHGFESINRAGDVRRTEDERAAFIVAVTEAMADGVDIRTSSLIRWDTQFMPRMRREEFVVWLAERCDRPIPTYAERLCAAA